MIPSPVRGIRPLGERAVLVELPGNATVRRLVARLPGALGGVEEIVAGHETVMICWERGRSAPADLATRIAHLLEGGQERRSPELQRQTTAHHGASGPWHPGHRVHGRGPEPYPER